MHWPQSKEEARKYRYNRWAGNPTGRKFDDKRCAAAVWTTGRGAMEYQCRRSPGKGPDHLYCGIHAKKAIQKGGK